MKRSKICCAVISIILGIILSLVTKHFVPTTPLFLFMLIYFALFSAITISIYSLIKKIDVRQSISILGMGICGIILIFTFFIGVSLQEPITLIAVIPSFFGLFIFYAISQKKGWRKLESGIFCL